MIWFTLISSSPESEIPSHSCCISMSDTCFHSMWVIMHHSIIMPLTSIPPSVAQFVGNSLSNLCLAYNICSICPLNSQYVCFILIDVWLWLLSKYRVHNHGNIPLPGGSSHSSICACLTCCGYYSHLSAFFAAAPRSDLCDRTPFCKNLVSLRTHAILADKIDNSF
jgi:hypothetical protein